MAIYKGRVKGTYRVVVWYRGRSVERIVRGSRADAKAYETRLQLELEAQAPSGVRVAPTFFEFSTGRYRLHAESELGDSTWANRKYELAELNEAFGDLRLTAITTELIEAWKAKRAREIGKRSVNRELMALSAVLSFARHIQIPAGKPAIRKFKVPRQRRHAESWTADEVARLYAACERHDPGLLPLLVFLLNTGCRKAEAIAMRWSEVDLDRRLLRIWPRPDDDEDPFDTKSREPREVTISDALLPFLLRAERRAEWVFPTRSRRRFAYFPKKRFQAVVKAAGLTGGPHRCRHTYATHFLLTTPDLYLLGRQLGQSTERVTAMYAHLLPEHFDRARNAVSFAPGLTAAELEAKRRWKS